MFVTTDYFLDGRGNGEVAEQLGACRFDPGLLRPYIDKKGRKCVTYNTGQTVYNKETGIEEPVYKQALISDLTHNGVTSPVFNATSLRKDEWLQYDRAVLKAARQRLRAWSDLEAANSFGGFNAMSKMVLEHEAMTDPGEAVVDMDAMTEGRRDTSRFQLEGLPLPITHSDFWLSSRRLMVSRNSGTPIDTTMGEAAGRRVAETIEQTLIGTITGVTYGKASDYGLTPKVWGYTNHPDRITKTDMTVPTGANGPAVLSSWLSLRDLMYAQNFFGPFMAYTSTDYDRYLDDLFSTAEPSAGTLRTRLKEIDGVQDIRRLDYLTNTFTVILVQMTSDVARAVNGMEITTVQWESMGGMRLNFKVMAIKVPQLRSQYIGQTTSRKAGIGHGTTA